VAFVFQGKGPAKPIPQHKNPLTKISGNQY